jgi:hypothetical protein
MFGIPGEVFWPTAAFGALILLISGVVAVFRFLPRPKSRAVDQPEREALEELDQLRARISELEERLDFAERLLGRQREGERLGPPGEKRDGTSR